MYLGGSDDEDRIPDNDSKADDSTNGSPLKEECKLFWKMD